MTWENVQVFGGGASAGIVVYQWYEGFKWAGGLIDTGSSTGAQHTGVYCGGESVLESIDTADGPWLSMALVYGLLNSPIRTRRRLGVDHDLEAALRRTVTEGGVQAAAALAPLAAVPEFTVGDDPEEAAAVARRLGAVSIVVQGFDLPVLPDRVAWARRVLERLRASAGAGASK